LVEADPAALRAWYRELEPEKQVEFDHDWSIHGRPEQQTPPGAWNAWACIAGRGWGKTRTGAEFIIREAARLGGVGRAALVGRTGPEVWDVMVHGESGILAKSPPWFLPHTYKRSVIWPNGFQAQAYSAEEPKSLRGPQHHVYWAEELAQWQYPETWDMLQLGLRLGTHPRGIITTTPRPTPEIKAIVESAKLTMNNPNPLTVISAGSTYDNEDNLPSTFLHQILSKYEGTRLGRQEIYAKILSDTPGALWTQDVIDERRIKPHDKPEFLRIVVAIDPAVSTKENSAETGMVVVGLAWCNCRGGRTAEKHGFVLSDLSGQFTPLEWGHRAIMAYRRWGAHRIIAETNNGGDLVISNLESIDPTVFPQEVKASDGKRTRAEPVSALYEQGRVHHVGVHAQLEDQMCFPAGTLVTTRRGDIPIESVTTADQALTRKGWRRVLWSGQSGVEEVVEFEAGGHKLACTPGHRIWTNSDFVRCDSLHVGDMLLECTKSDPSSNSTAAGTFRSSLVTSAATDRSTTAGCSIAMFGRMPGGQSRPATTSTISTGTQETTRSRILKRFRHGSTSSSMGRAEPHLNQVQSEASGGAMNGQHESQLIAFAESAALASIAPASERSTARGNVSIAATVPALTAGFQLEEFAAHLMQRRVAVYDLTVEGEHEFFANRLLVSNCTWQPFLKGERSPDRVDALVWGLTSLMLEAEDATFGRKNVVSWSGKRRLAR